MREVRRVRQQQATRKGQASSGSRTGACHAEASSFIPPHPNCRTRIKEEGEFVFAKRPTTFFSNPPTTFWSVLFKDRTLKLGVRRRWLRVRGVTSPAWAARVMQWPSRVMQWPSCAIPRARTRTLHVMLPYISCDTLSVCLSFAFLCMFFHSFLAFCFLVF